MFAEDTGVRILHALLFEYRRGSHGGGALIWEHVVYRQRGTLEEEWYNGPEVRRHKKGRDVGAKQTARGSAFSGRAAESRYFMGRHTLLLWDAVRDFLWVEAMTAGGAARIVTRLRLSVCLSFCLQSLAVSERASKRVSETQRRERERRGGGSRGHILGLSCCRFTVWIESTSPVSSASPACPNLLPSSPRGTTRSAVTSLC